MKTKTKTRAKKTKGTEWWFWSRLLHSGEEDGDSGTKASEITSVPVTAISLWPILGEPIHLASRVAALTFGQS
jgi:hypothetical protein